LRGRQTGISRCQGEERGVPGEGKVALLKKGIKGCTVFAEWGQLEENITGRNTGNLKRERTTDLEPVFFVGTGESDGP